VSCRVVSCPVLSVAIDGERPTLPVPVFEEGMMQADAARAPIVICFPRFPATSDGPDRLREGEWRNPRSSALPNRDDCRPIIDLSTLLCKRTPSRPSSWHMIATISTGKWPRVTAMLRSKRDTRLLCAPPAENEGEPSRITSRLNISKGRRSRASRG